MLSCCPSGETNEDYSLSKKYLHDLIFAGLDEVAVFIVPLLGSKLLKTGMLKRMTWVGCRLLPRIIQYY